MSVERIDLEWNEWLMSNNTCTISARLYSFSFSYSISVQVNNRKLWNWLLNMVRWFSLWEFFGVRFCLLALHLMMQVATSGEKIIKLRLMTSETCEQCLSQLTSSEFSSSFSSQYILLQYYFPLHFYCICAIHIAHRPRCHTSSCVIIVIIVIRVCRKVESMSRFRCTLERQAVVYITHGTALHELSARNCTRRWNLKSQN